MRIRVFSSMALLLAMVFVAASQAAPPNLSGKYKLNPAKSEGVPPDMTQVMSIRQNGNELIVDTKIYPPEGLANVVTDIYLLNGQETEYKATRGMAIGKGKRVAKWNPDGTGLEITEEATLDLPQQGTVKIPTTRKWTIAADGKEIVIELMTKDPQRGEVKSKRVFTKI